MVLAEYINAHPGIMENKTELRIGSVNGTSYTRDDIVAIIKQVISDGGIDLASINKPAADEESGSGGIDAMLDSLGVF